jgi:cysteine desulfurase/selenocysteine lyase
LDLNTIGAYEQELLNYATGRLSEVPGLRIIGTARQKAAVISFVLENPRVSSMDIGRELDLLGICVRTGHHCCQPVMDRFGVGSTARASFAFYNTRAEVDALVAGLLEIVAARSQKQAAGTQNEETQVVYPAATAENVQEAAKKLAEDFEFLEDGEQKSEYVMDLAKELPNLFPLLKQVTPRVQGCMSEVYLVGRTKPGTQDVFEFVADADAEIVRGLIAVLERIYSGQRASDVLDFDVEQFFESIGLERFITQQRRNGLAGMVKRIRESAGQIARSAGAA